MFVKTIELAAATAVHSVDPDRWWTEYSAMLDRIAPRFARYEPLRHAGELILGMVSRTPDMDTPSPGRRSSRTCDYLDSAVKNCSRNAQ